MMRSREQQVCTECDVLKHISRFRLLKKTNERKCTCLRCERASRPRITTAAEQNNTTFPTGPTTTRYAYVVRSKSGTFISEPTEEHRGIIKKRNAKIRQLQKEDQLADVEQRWLDEKVRLKNGDYDVE